MAEFILNLAAQYPVVSSILFVIGAFRAVFKPLHGVVQYYVDFTESDSDNKKWEEIQKSKWYLAVAWFVDYTASIKLPGRV